MDSRWGAFCMAGGSLPAMLQPRSSVRRHAGRTRTYGRIPYTRGVSELEVEERQYFIRQESGLQEADMPCQMESAATCSPDLSTPARSAAVWKKHSCVYYHLSNNS